MHLSLIVASYVDMGNCLLGCSVSAKKKKKTAGFWEKCLLHSNKATAKSTDLIKATATSSGACMGLSSLG